MIIQRRIRCECVFIIYDAVATADNKSYRAENKPDRRKISAKWLSALPTLCKDRCA